MEPLKGPLVSLSSDWPLPGQPPVLAHSQNQWMSPSGMWTVLKGSPILVFLSIHLCFYSSLMTLKWDLFLSFILLRLHVSSSSNALPWSTPPYSKMEAKRLHRKLVAEYHVPCTVLTCKAGFQTWLLVCFVHFQHKIGDSCYRLSLVWAGTSF